MRVARGAFFYQQAGAFYLSVPFENIGAGVAAVVEAEMDPAAPGSIYLSRKFVPVGEIVRVNISVMPEISRGERFRDFFWAMDPVSVAIRYTDANGRQEMMSRATIKQFATQGPFISEIAIFRAGQSEPIAIGRGSY